MKSATLILAAGVLCFAPLGNEASSETLSGLYPTCWEPWEVEQADMAASQQNWDDWKKFKCGLLGSRGMRVRVIRCATDVTDKKMQHFSRPVPRDDSLPVRICEVEAFFDDGSSGIGYTFYFNIERSP